MLENVRGNNPIILEPSFEPSKGFLYQDIRLNTLQEQINLLELAEMSEIATRGRAVVSIQ